MNFDGRQCFGRPAVGLDIRADGPKLLALRPQAARQAPAPGGGGLRGGVREEDYRALDAKLVGGIFREVAYDDATVESLLAFRYILSRR